MADITPEMIEAELKAAGDKVSTVNYADRKENAAARHALTKAVRELVTTPYKDDSFWLKFGRLETALETWGAK